jgi:hypothetical protein
MKRNGTTTLIVRLPVVGESVMHAQRSSTWSCGLGGRGKIRGASNDSPDSRYSPATCIGCRTGVLAGGPDPRRRLDERKLGGAMLVVENDIQE